MKLFIMLNLLSLNLMAATSTIKFTANTNGPGVSVEGEAKKTNLKLDFKKLEATNIVIDVMDLSTGMEKRDKHLHEKVFNTAAFGLSKIEYSISKINCPTQGSDVECDCVGNLKIKEINNEIKFKAKINRSSETIEGKALISLGQYKLTAPSFMGITVEDNVEVIFKVSAK